MTTLDELRADRFWSQVNKTPACWEWMGGHSEGYGRCYLGNYRNGYAHRVAYEMLVGPILDGLTLDHLCRNRSCVNPAHLEPVSRRVNTLRGDTIPARNAVKTHCSKGHEFTPANTYWRRDEPNSRMCRQCQTIRNKRRFQ